MIQIQYHYDSAFAPYIEGLIRQKKADGFIYDYEAYILKTFDRFCLDNGYVSPLITRDIAMKWALQRKSEGINYRNQRVSFLRQLSLYMNSMGINSYIPRFTPSESVTVPHILNQEELQALFRAVDTYLPENPKWQRLSMEYQILFRLYYCCGMRLAEGCDLEKKDVDLQNGILTIRQSKGRKDRLVHMNNDLTVLCRKYLQKITQLVPHTIWFFPGRTPEMHIQKTSIDKKFKQLWGMTLYAGKCDKEPTVHALRHTFVVNRMNQWMVEGIPLDVMMPYLSRYLGHSGIEDTMYYYHQVRDAFRVVRQNDLISDKVIPEVVPYKSRIIPEGTLFFSMTLEFLETYMPRQLGRSPETIKSYRDSLTIFRRYLYSEKKISMGKFRFEDCTPKLIQDFIIHIKESGNSPGTCNQRLTAIKMYLWFAADRNIALQSTALVISKIPQCKVPKREKETLSEEALRCILQQPRNTKIGMRDRTMMILLYDSAIRLDELLSLTIQNLMLDGNSPYIRLNGKGNKERIVAITPKTVAHLQVYLNVFHSNTDRNAYVFYTKIKGKTGKMSEGNVERFLQQYSMQARKICTEIPKNVYPHMFRRTRATDLYQHGVELALISRILGHSSIETAKIYATPSMEMLRKAIESVETPEQAQEKPLWEKCSEEDMAKLCGLR